MSLAYQRLALSFSIILAARFSGAEEPKNAAKQTEFFELALASVPEGAAERTLSPYFFVRSDDGSDRLPLKSTRVNVDIAGVIARVRTEQLYQNRGDSTLEAIYIFPASTSAALSHMRLTVGQRVIEAQIRKRAEARAEYEKALQEGRTASLLEQMRPNVFQMSVGNILPGDEIRVELEYTELLLPEEGEYRFIYPTVVGPRYSNQPAAGAPVEDKWVENPYLHRGETPPMDFELELRLHAGMPVTRATCPSHPAEVLFFGEREVRVKLAGDPHAANRDFVFHYALAGERIEAGLLLFRGEKENFFLALVEPPARPREQDELPRELIFILDVSGSMDGFPLEVAKTLILCLLGDLRSRDAFNVLLFSGGSAVLAKHPLEATRQNVALAERWIKAEPGGGGTELLPALKRALALPQSPERSRTVVLITDGYVTVEQEAFELVRASLGKANLFAFGIGTAVNRHLIEGLARAGLGEPFVVANEQEAEQAAERFRRYLEAPVLKDVRVDIQELQAYDVEPPALGDLFARRPLAVFGKFREPAAGRLVLTGRNAAGPWQKTLAFAGADDGDHNSALRVLWARHRLEALQDLDTGEDRDLGREITRLGLEYGLLSRYTSFVAVDTEVRANGKTITTVHQPLPLPPMVSELAVGNGAGYGGSYGVLGCLSSGRGRGVAVRSTVMGSLSSSGIQAAISRQVHTVRQAYARALLRNPNIAGKVVLQIVIGADGLVARVLVQQTDISDQAFLDDLVKVVRSFSFPTPLGGGQVVIVHPFIFQPAG